MICKQLGGEKGRERSARNGHMPSEIPDVCDSVWRVRKGRLGVQGKTSVNRSLLTRKRGEVKVGKGRRKRMC